ncbi:MAG: aminoglycoside 6-adenylyltransferase [Actinobacteria bacterium]|nr:aminoglycoside 6-adenylyltransferase [Actinomycetota bacterium]
MRQAEVLERLVAWGEEQPSVRAMILTSSLARPDAPLDILSDVDVILAVTDPERFAQDSAWQSDYGAPMVRWSDQSDQSGLTTYFRGVVYRDGAKIDYSIWPADLLAHVAEAPVLPDELDVGYRVLLDKDGRTSGWSAPTYRAHIPARPTEAEYRDLVEEFWWGTTYVAKSLWRDEIVFAKFILDQDLRLGALRVLLEWRIEIDHDWSLKPGWFGRGLKRLLPADTWSELESTYVGAGSDENWAALFRTTALFRRIAKEVGQALGYEYPHQVDDQVAAYLEEIRSVPGASAPPSRR